MEDRRIKEILIEKNSRFKEIYLQHQEYEQQLHEILINEIRTDKELFEEQSIKKHKLQLKDQMQKYIIDYRNKVLS